MEVNIHGQTNLNTSQEDTGGHFEEAVYNDLPQILKAGTDILSGNDKEAFFAGSLAALSSVLPGVRAVYDGKTIEANLYLFLYGSFGCGKGALKYVRKLVSPVHKFMSQKFTEPKNKEDEPLRKLHFLPANTSKSGLIELLAVNGRGLIFETEADTLADILKQDYGNFTDLLNKCYHHEEYPFYRRQNKEYIEIDEPKLSVLLSGTNSQLQNLVPGVENGLFSRFMYYRLEMETGFKNVFDTSGGDLYQRFSDIGEQVFDLHKQLYHAAEPVIFKLQSHQESEFLTYFQDLKQTLIDLYGVKVGGSVNRFALQYFRILMILTTLRAYEKSELRHVLICQDIDFKNTKRIFETFIWHALTIFDSLAVKDTKGLPQDKQQFFSKLPAEFTTVEAITTGKEFEIPERTVKRFLKNRQLFEYVRHGNYKKN